MTKRPGDGSANKKPTKSFPLTVEENYGGIQGVDVLLYTSALAYGIDITTPNEHQGEKGCQGSHA